MEEINFSALPISDRETVIKWLKENFVAVEKINFEHTAYGLKQKVTRLTEIYLTEKQFYQAMLEAGFSSEEKIPGHYSFNIGKSSPFFSRT
jgi:hypothetical protein